MSTQQEKEGNKKYPLLHTEAITRKNLLTNERGEYSVKYDFYAKKHIVKY